MKNIITLIILLLLTGLAATASLFMEHGDLLITAVLAVGAAKLLLVAFQFMELKHAHLFWKSILCIFCVAFVITISMIL